MEWMGVRNNVGEKVKRYLINKDGKIKLKYGTIHHPDKKPGYILSPGFNGHHMQIRLTIKKGIMKAFSVHRLVWQTFIGRIPKDFVVHHINGNPCDNKLKNLELMKFGEHSSFEHMGEKNGMYGKKISKETRRKMIESQQKRRSHPNKGVSEQTRKKLQGEKSSSAVLNTEQVLEIRKKGKSENLTYEEIGQYYGVSKGCIYGILTYHTWRHI